MTDPNEPTRPADPWPPAEHPPAAPEAPPPWSVSGTPATVPMPVPYAPPPVSFGGYGTGAATAEAPFGYDPVTGRPYSDKSKVVAGLLQLLLGFMFALGGVGRLYAGNTGMGVTQIIASVVGWISFFCGFVLIVPWVISAAVWLWFVIDGIMLLAGRPVDGQGRALRA
jgi:TM2 domain-containing membrane protein YozV